MNQSSRGSSVLRSSSPGMYNPNRNFNGMWTLTQVQNQQAFFDAFPQALTAQARRMIEARDLELEIRIVGEFIRVVHRNKNKQVYRVIEAYFNESFNMMSLFGGVVQCKIIHVSAREIVGIHRQISTGKVVRRYHLETIDTGTLKVTDRIKNAAMYLLFEKVVSPPRRLSAYPNR